jgi:hypothetical protein
MIFCINYSKEKCEFVKNCFYNKHHGVYGDDYGLTNYVWWNDALINTIYCPLTKGIARVSNITKLEYYMRRAINEQDSKD